MHRVLFAFLLFSVASLFPNGAGAQNIAHGVRVVVIDAGHGGKFPGANYAGIREKDLTLKAKVCRTRSSMQRPSANWLQGSQTTRTQYR